MCDEMREAVRAGVVHRDYMVSDDELEAVFKGTNFGNSKPRDIVDETLLKIAGDFSPGNTALVCCQELGLVGKNKHVPRLTKKGRRYHYYAQAALASNPQVTEGFDYHRVREWMLSSPRKPANQAFTAGAERNAAYLIEEYTNKPQVTEGEIAEFIYDEWLRHPKATNYGAMVMVTRALLQQFEIRRKW